MEASGVTMGSILRSSVEEGECPLNDELLKFMVLLLIGGFGLI
jgi:hypothetical protein